MKTVVAALAVCSLTTIAQASTIATFSDTGTLSFSFTDIGSNNDGIGSLDASNNDIEVILPSLGITFNDASFTLTDSNGGSLETVSQTDVNGLIQAQFEGGILSIVTDVDVAAAGLSAGDAILTATFDSAFGLFGNLLSADTFMGNNVSFGGFAVNGLPPLVAESFAFSAANVTPGAALLAPADMEDWTATVAFTSSAQAIPVPAALPLFISALLGLFGPRQLRRRFAR